MLTTMATASAKMRGQGILDLGRGFPDGLAMIPAKMPREQRGGKENAD